jgi:hypothetical protein
MQIMKTSFEQVCYLESVELISVKWGEIYQALA